MPGTRKVGGKRNATKKGGQWYMPWSQKEKEPVYTHEVDYFPGTKIIKMISGAIIDYWQSYNRFLAEL